jgi:hypothetical protein
MSPIKMLLGPPWTDTGEPGAWANNDCCDALEGLSPEGHDMASETQDAASNKLHRATRAGILTTVINTSLLSVSCLRRFGVTISSGQSVFSAFICG